MKTMCSKLVAMLLMVLTGTAFATECVWDANGTGGWSAETQWVNGVRPTQSGDTVTISGEDVTATVTDSDVANFQLVSSVTISKASSKLVIDVSSDFSTPSVFNGSGTLEKRGASTMTLTTAGSGVRTTVGDLGMLLISNGTFQMPNRESTIQLPKVTVNAPGVLSLGNSPGTSAFGLWGDGTIRNDNSGCQLYLYFNDQRTPPVFAGKFEGKVELTPYYSEPSGIMTPSIQYFTGNETAIGLNLRIWHYRRGVLGK